MLCNWIFRTNNEIRFENSPMYRFLWLSYDIFGMEQPASIMARYYDYYYSFVIKFFQMREILANVKILASSLYEHSPYDRLVSLTTWIIDLFCLAGALLFGKDCGKCFLYRKPKPLPLLGSSICIISCGGLCLLIATLIILIFTVPSQR